MITKCLQSNSTTDWGDGLRFVLVMKNWAYHESIKCSLYEAIFGQPIKVGLQTSNLPDDEIEDIFTEEELEKVVSGEHEDKQNNLTEDSVEEIHVETSNGTSINLVDNADIEGSVFIEVQ